MSVGDAVGWMVNRVLAPSGLLMGRAAPSQFESWRERIGDPYRTDRAVIRAARRRGMSVADLIESEWGHPGRARRTVALMRDAGVVPTGPHTVCEIGPGSGRYIQALLEVAKPRRYEIYEIERARARWLARTYPVVALPTNGEQLAGTPDGSVDLVHAHGVYASLKVVSCFASFMELIRITAPGGHIVFDVITEECLSDAEVDAWLETPLRYVQFLSRSHLVGFFERRGCELVADFRLPLMVFGQSLYLAFKKADG